MSKRILQNYAHGTWRPVRGIASVDVTNPATGEVLAVHPMSDAEDIEEVVASASEAFNTWRRVPVPARASILFRYRHLLTEATNDLAEIITAENGKTIAESRGELVRAIQYVEHAAAAPETMKGAVTANIGDGVDIEYIREPLGAFAVVAPFNFPAMIPLYFSWAVATGNTVVIKPSEHCPLTTIRMVELAEEAGFPPGVVNVLLGGANVVDALCVHPGIAGVSFVGSSEIAKIVYARASSSMKRCQAQGGANNHLVVTDSAILDRCLANMVSSLYGNASQRCFAGSNLLVYRSVYDQVVERLIDSARALVLGNGVDPGVTLGPVISAQSRARLIAAVDEAESAGAAVLMDGRNATVAQYPQGYWLGPTLLDAQPTSSVWTSELFGPVRCIAPVEGLDEAMSIINASEFGHTAVIYTELGGEARRFREGAFVGQIGINIGTPAPIAFYPVGGRKASFYGSLRGRAEDAVDFYTDKKVIVSTWYADTSTVAGVDPAFETR
jgi:malonate-semialdehyde dehydrogenase (acetylating)/methylmalonate-semialdehyde dehydrogenase